MSISGVFMFYNKKLEFREPNARINTLIDIIDYNINEDMHGINDYRG